jgi:hypothetical protein
MSMCAAEPSRRQLAAAVLGMPNRPTQQVFTPMTLPDESE